MRGVLTFALVVVVGGCGSVKTGDPDAGAGNPDGPTTDQPDARVDAAPPDAMVDAAPAFQSFNSALLFPTGGQVIQTFTPTELASLGVTATGLPGAGSTSIVGNPDSPISTTIFIENNATSVVTFTFATPITAVGVSSYDADYGHDNAIIVSVTAVEPTTLQPIQGYQRALAPANSSAEQNAGAVFVGFSYAQPFTTVQVAIDQANSTGFDNLRFR